MPNPIKYTAGTETLALKKGNFYIGTRDVAKGPTSATGYYAGITPPANGYTIYLNKASSGPSIYVATGATDLITITNRIAGTNYTTSGECLNYFATQTDKMVFNRDYESIITSGLTFNVDAGFTPSYPTTGTTWYDISLSGNNGTLVNGPTYSGGSIVFDGSDDYGDFGNGSSISFGQNKSFTIEVIFKTPNFSQDVGTLIARRNTDNSSSTDYMIFYQNNQLNFGTGEASDNGAWIRSNDFNFNNQIMFATMVLNSTGSQTGTKQIYKDGKLTANVSYAVKAPSTTNNTYIGKYNGLGGYFNGNIYSTKIYNRALSSSEVLQNYQSTFTRFLGENIVGNGLALYLDAGYSLSYPGTGTTWSDVSGNGNNGTLTNGPTFSANTIVFDGSDDYVSLGNVVNVTTEPFTLNAWFKQTYDGNYQAIITKGTGAGTGVGYRMLTTPSNPPQVYIDVSDNITSNTFLSNNTIKPGVWNNVLMVRESLNTFRIYINGILDKTVIKNVGNISSSYPLQVGKQSDASYIFKGQMSVASIYTKPLTPFDVYQNYSAQKSRFGIPDIVTNGLVLNLDAGNPYSYNPLNTGSTRWADVTNSTTGGTLVNGTFYSGGTMAFDGVDDYVNCGNDNNLNLFNTITIESWVRWTGNNAINFTPIVEKQYDNQDTYFFGFNGSSRLHFGSSGGNIQSTNTTWTIGQWYLVTATYSSNPSITGALYINGAPEPLSVNSLDTMSSTSSPVYIGYRYSQNIYFKGDIAGVKIYNRALSSSEVLQNYNATKERYGL